MIKIIKENDYIHSEFKDIMYVSEPYKIITKLSVFDNNRDPDDEDYVFELVDEQDEVLRKRGYDKYDTEYLLEFLSIKNDNRFRFDFINEGIEYLALKDGADLVEFKDGNVGYVGYYSGFRDNAFKIHNISADDITYAITDNNWYYVLANDSAARLLNLILGITPEDIPTNNIKGGDNFFVISPDFRGYDTLSSVLDTLPYSSNIDINESELEYAVENKTRKRDKSMIKIKRESDYPSSRGWERKRVTDPDRGYMYIMKHGIGPGTIPKDVTTLKVDDDLPEMKTIVWLDRPLSDEELEYFDIPSETENGKWLKRLGVYDKYR